MEQRSLADLNIVRSITNTLGGGTKKSFGQNFLINQKTLFRFVDLLNLNKDNTVIEVGPGIGVVSYTLCQKAGQVILIELDKTKEPALLKTLQNFSNYKIVWEDATKITFHSSSFSLHSKFKLIGSLPYNAGKKIIYNFVTSGLEWSIAAFFLQKEVAESYASLPPKADFLSTFIRIFADIELMFIVPPEHFFPKPRVSTGVIKLIKHDKYNYLDKIAFSNFIKQGYSHPRKTVWNNLKCLNLRVEDFNMINLNPQKRPGEIMLDEWEKLYIISSK